MGELSRTFATVTVVSPVGGDEVAPIPATCDLTVKPLIVQAGDVIVDKRPHVLRVEEGVLRGSGEWFIPGRYAVTPDSGVARGFVVDIPAGHTEDDPFNLADAVPIDPATPLPWMPREEDVAAVAEARDEALEAAYSAELSAEGAADHARSAASHSVAAAGDADRAVAAADRAEASASTVQGFVDAVVGQADAAALAAAESGRAAIEAEASAEAARAEREALSAAIAAGDYRGETGPEGPPGADSTVPGPPGPANALTIGTVTTGATASASITGEAPEQTLNLTLPRGPQGAPGAPGGTYVPSSDLIGPGRPDQPATTGGLVTGAETVGTVYRSTDGGGVGAWAWRKRPTGWEVVDGDTGWRDMAGAITESASAPVAGSIAIKRTGGRICLDFANVNLPNAKLTLPVGFRHRKRFGWSGGPVIAGDDGGSVALRWSYFNPSAPWLQLPGRLFSASPSWGTADPWPTVLPGTPM